ncbi:MAG: YbaB/EbfC family nucleoid-associated protein [Planctomycetota bacterium]|jgi:DNA-binding YbaB/EbfC family protein
MFDNLKNLGSIMKQAGEFKERAEQMKQELERKTVEGESGGGAVRVTLNGKGRCLRIELDEPLLMGIAGDDRAMVEELIAAAYNAGIDKVQELVAEEMNKAAGGIDIPGLQNMLGDMS